MRYWTICLKIVRFCSVRGRPSVYLCKPSCFRLFPDFSSCSTRAIIILNFYTNSYCFPFNESPWNKFSSDSFVPDNWWPRNIENREFLDVGLNALEFALGKWETVIKLDVLRVPSCCRQTMLITCKGFKMQWIRHSWLSGSTVNGPFFGTILLSELGGGERKNGEFNYIWAWNWVIVCVT